tara:strand:+ start:169 stop:684 length:516 start_codon:yes stop_codon:yes gene_type:complete
MINKQKNGGSGEFVSSRTRLQEASRILQESKKIKENEIQKRVDKMKEKIFPKRKYSKLPTDIKELIVSKAINPNFLTGKIENELKTLKLRIDMVLKNMTEIDIEIEKKQKLLKKKKSKKKQEELKNKLLELKKTKNNQLTRYFTLNESQKEVEHDKRMAEMTYLFKKTNIR